MAKVTKKRNGLSFASQRYLAIDKGKKNIDDFPKEEVFTLYNVSRDCIIHCSKSSLSYYFKNFNYFQGGKMI